MKIIHPQSIITVMTLLILSSCHKPINVQDDFEAASLKNIWSTDRMEEQSFEIQPAIVRNGKHAAKITLHTGDVVEQGNDSSKASERYELREAKELWSVEGKKYEYTFSLFIPADFPVVPTRLVIAQWKEKCPQNACSDDSPVLAVRYSKGRLFITRNLGKEKDTLYLHEGDIRGRWLDFKFSIRFSSNERGEISAFLNGKSVIQYKSVTAYKRL